MIVRIWPKGSRIAYDVQIVGQDELTPKIAREILRRAFPGVRVFGQVWKIDPHQGIESYGYRVSLGSTARLKAPRKPGRGKLFRLVYGFNGRLDMRDRDA